MNKSTSVQQSECCFWITNPETEEKLKIGTLATTTSLAIVLIACAIIAAIAHQGVNLGGINAITQVIEVQWVYFGLSFALAFLLMNVVGIGAMCHGFINKFFTPKELDDLGVTSQIETNYISQITAPSSYWKITKEVERQTENFEGKPAAYAIVTKDQNGSVSVKGFKTEADRAAYIKKLENRGYFDGEKAYTLSSIYPKEFMDFYLGKDTVEFISDLMLKDLPEGKYRRLFLYDAGTYAALLALNAKGVKELQFLKEYNPDLTKDYEEDKPGSVHFNYYLQVEQHAQETVQKDDTIFYILKCQYKNEDKTEVETIYFPTAETRDQYIIDHLPTSIDVSEIAMQVEEQFHSLTDDGIYPLQLKKTLNASSQDIFPILIKEGDQYKFNWWLTLEEQQKDIEALKKEEEDNKDAAILTSKNLLLEKIVSEEKSYWFAENVEDKNKSPISILFYRLNNTFQSKIYTFGKPDTFIETHGLTNVKDKFEKSIEYPQVMGESLASTTIAEGKLLAKEYWAYKKGLNNPNFPLFLVVLKKEDGTIERHYFKTEESQSTYKIFLKKNNFTNGYVRELDQLNFVNAVKIAFDSQPNPELQKPFYIIKEHDQVAHVVAITEEKKVLSCYYPTANLNQELENNFKGYVRRDISEWQNLPSPSFDEIQFLRTKIFNYDLDWWFENIDNKKPLQQNQFIIIEKSNYLCLIVNHKPNHNETFFRESFLYRKDDPELEKAKNDYLNKGYVERKIVNG